MPRMVVFGRLVEDVEAPAGSQRPEHRRRLETARATTSRTAGDSCPSAERQSETSWSRSNTVLPASDELRAPTL